MAKNFLVLTELAILTLMPRSWKNRRVLVTGGTGFVGSFLVERLLDQGARVRVPTRSENYRSLSPRRSEIEWMEGDLRDPAYCAALMEGVDEVMHLASCRRNVDYHQKKCSDVLNENVRMSLALIDGLKEQGLSIPVTFVSTANVPLSVDTIALSSAPTVDGYVLGKALCESLWFSASRQRSFPLLIVRPVGVYGPRDTFTEEGNVIPALMVRMRDAEDHVTVWGNGEQERAFLYVEDFTTALFALLDNDIQGIQYVSSSDVVTVRQLSEKLRDLVRPELKIIFDPKRPVGERTIPLLPMHDVLQSVEWTPLDVGLQKTFTSWQHA